MDGSRGIVFFDVGGTLVERSGDEVAQMVTAWRDLGLGGTQAELAAALDAMAHAYIAGCYAPRTESGEARLWRALAITALTRTAGGATAERVAALAGALAGHSAWYRPVPAMARALDDLRRSGRRVGIISNWPPSLPRFLAAMGLGEFAVVAGSGALGMTKPGLAIFAWALAAAGCAPGEAVYVGNDPVCDLAPAQAAGMEAILWDPARKHTQVTVATEAELRQALGLPPSR